MTNSLVRRNGAQPLAASQRPASGKADAIQALLEKHGPEIAMVLPQHVTPERLLRIAISEVRRNPKLANCSSASLLSAIFSCASLGLEPGGPLGHAYLIPYGQECTFQVGYKGMIDLARRSGQIESLSARAVYELDSFQYSFGLHEDLVHQPATGERGQLTHAYAVARLKDGGIQFEVMDRRELEEVRDGSQGYQMAKKYNKNDTPWISSFDEMCRKTVIRRLFKYLPVSVEISKVVSLDEAGDYGRRQESELDHILLPDPATQAPTPALAAAAAPVATLTEQQVSQVRMATTRQLTPVGVAAFEASICQACGVEALEGIPAELHTALMSRLADPANRDRWDRGCDHLSGESILTADQIAELLPQEEEEPQQEEAPAPASAPAPAATRKAAPAAAPAVAAEPAETADAQGELV
jgi:recombination protein RecT